MSDFKKKRGRKPKNKISKTKEINNIDKDNLIVHIKLKTEDKDETEILPGYVEEKYEIERVHDIHCWNCYQELKKSYKSLPIKYINNIFYIMGNFCDLSCTLRYLLDNFNGRELWSKYELFNYYTFILYGKHENIIPAPDRLSLKIFGGNLTNEEYKNNNMNYNEINIPIIIPINNTNLKYENTKINENKGELKLYRKNKKNNDCILNNMKI